MEVSLAGAGVESVFEAMLVPYQRAMPLKTAKERPK